MYSKGQTQPYLLDFVKQLATLVVCNVWVTTHKFQTVVEVHRRHAEQTAGSPGSRRYGVHDRTGGNEGTPR